MSVPRRCDCTRTDSPEFEEWMPVSEHEAEMAIAKRSAVHHQIGVATPVTFNARPPDTELERLRAVERAARELTASWSPRPKTLDQATSWDALRSALDPPSKEGT